MQDGNIKFEWYEHILAESENYYIKGTFESADLYSKSDNRRIAQVGDFYGDPEDGLIDRYERFCITVGCGYIIYFLREPFEDYMYDKNTKQWIEGGRNADNTKWIEAVRQVSDNEAEITDEYGNTEIIEIPML